MHCELVGSLLPNYLDEDLTEELAQQVQAHLVRCRRCAWEVESIRQSVAALRESSEAASPSAEFRARLLGELLRDHRAAAARRPGVLPSRERGASGSVYVLDSGEEEKSHA